MKIRKKVLCVASLLSVVAAPSLLLAEEGLEFAFSHTVAAQTWAVASIAVSPTGDRLYAVTLAGQIMRWRIDSETGALSDAQVLELPHFQDEEGPRGLIGLAFDPADPQVLWVTDNYPVARFGARAAVPDFSGRISRVRIAEGDAFAGEAEAYVRGLPRSCSDHLSNSLTFRTNPDVGSGPDHLLYLTQGSNSAMGEADKGWCFRPERLLTAAVLEIDPRRTPPPGGFDVATEPLPDDGESRRFGHDWVLGRFMWASADSNPKAAPIPIDSGPYAGALLRFGQDGVAEVWQNDTVLRRFYDPFALDAPVRLFATGIRNGYDLLWHSDGRLYVPANGSIAGGAAPDDPRTTISERVDRMGRAEDFLFVIAGGEYSGHPNPLRDEFIANGGNPTPEVDPNEIVDYSVGVRPDARYDPKRALALGFHWSPNGIVEYQSDAFGGRLNGVVIVANYSKGNNLRVLRVGDGEFSEDFTLRDPEGNEITYPDPLDIVAGPGGRLYVSTLERSNGRSQIVKLEPGEVSYLDSAQ